MKCVDHSCFYDIPIDVLLVRLKPNLKHRFYIRKCVLSCWDWREVKQKQSKKIGVHNRLPFLSEKPAAFKQYLVPSIKSSSGFLEKPPINDASLYIVSVKYIIVRVPVHVWPKSEEYSLKRNHSRYPDSLFYNQI